MPGIEPMPVAEPRGIDLVVLAGGFGTRLRDAVPDVPKPLAPVGERPFLHYQIANWIEQGVTSLTFLLHHRADLITAFLHAERRDGMLGSCELRVLTEPEPLGTGGAVAYAVDKLQLRGSFLVTNADTWLGGGIAATVRARAPCMAVIEVEDCERYGQVRIAQGGQVVAFEEKRAGAAAGWINAGLYHLHADLFAERREPPFSLERDLFPGLVQAGSLASAKLACDFIDIGIPADYFRFCRWVESGRVGAL